ncbi:MAG: fimbrial biogenesis outer membrane usher protein [Rubrivivax sp.]|nr:fimbrial biogenesis outer membrane usher protein [Rubrivivax sp.]
MAYTDTRALTPAGNGPISAIRLPGRTGDAGTLTRRLAGPRAACACLLLAAYFALAAPTQAQPKAETLLLDIRVNDRSLAGIVHAERLADGRLALPAELWTQARLKAAGEPVTLSDGTRGYVLEAVPGIVYKLDRSRLALDITAPPAAFDSTLLSLRGSLTAPTPPPLGAYLNYDLSATRAGRTSTGYGALVEGVAFGRWGALVASGVVRADEQSHSTIRLDTYWRTDLPGRMETLVLGDTVGTGGAWSRPVRYGGLRYAREFNLAPGFVTYPTPSISGSAALPSTVDVLINNRRSAQSNVQPGPFELTNVPIVTGAGQIQLVVRDMLGRETVINQSYYIAPLLLAPGLSDFSFEAGALRKNYGTRSSDYSSVFGAGTYRLGITDALTGEVRAEVQRDRAAAGAGVAAVVGDLAVVAFAAGYAVADGERGRHYVASIQRSTPKGGASIAAEHFDRGYRQFGAGAFETRPKHQIVAGGSLAFGLGVTAGLSYTQRTPWEGARFALVGAHVGIALPGNMHLSAYATQSLNAGKGFAGGLNLIIPLDDRRMMAASSARDASGHVVNTVQATQSVPAGPGWGWRVAGSDSETQRLQAGTTYNSNNAQFTAQANAGQDANAVRLGANGSLGWMSGLAFASRRIDQGAFAVVQVGDLEGVAVSLSNQVVAVTNSKGLALVTGLLPYQLNQLTLDADLLPFGVEIGGVRETVVPYARSGAFIDFPVKRSRDALVVLQQPDGAPVPAGARVTVTPGHQKFIVARRGEVYLVDLADDNRIKVRWKDGGCSMALKMATVVPGAEPPRIGPLVCGGAQ